MMKDCATATSESSPAVPDHKPKFTKELRIVLESLNLPVKRKRSLSAEDEQAVIKKVKFGDLFLTVNCVVDPPKKQGLSCPVCRKSFKESSALIYHQIHHPELAVMAPVSHPQLIDDGLVGPLVQEYRHDSGFSDKTGTLLKSSRVRVKSLNDGNIQLVADAGQVMKNPVNAPLPGDDGSPCVETSSPRIRIREILARSPEKDPLFAACFSEISSCAYSPTPLSDGGGSELTVRHDAVGPLNGDGVTIKPDAAEIVCPAGVVTPPPSVGDASEQTLAALEKRSPVENGHSEECTFFDEDDFDVIIESNPRDTEPSESHLSVSVAESSSLRKSGGTEKLNGSEEVTNVKKSSPHQRCGVKELVRRERQIMAAGRRRSAPAKSRFDIDRRSLDSDDAAAGFSDLTSMLPRQSLRRDVKNDKRISYTTTKITGEIGGGTGSNGSQSVRRSLSVVVNKLPATIRSPVVITPLSRVLSEVQQNGGLSDGSSSDSERRFSERQFKGDKPFLCNHCPLSFSTLEKKAVHERTHEEKPIECPVCSMRFSMEISLKKHIKIHR